MGEGVAVLIIYGLLFVVSIIVKVRFINCVVLSRQTLPNMDRLLVKKEKKRKEGKHCYGGGRCRNLKVSSKDFFSR